MICDCRHCHKTFWKYWPIYELPPRGYCSVPCFDQRGMRDSDPPPKFPEEILREMKFHRHLAHGSDSYLLDFDCEECERIEADYSVSLNYHYARITREIAMEGRMPS